jgi:protein gp37
MRTRHDIASSVRYPNDWRGVTVGNMKQGLSRIEILQTIPAAVRFVSFEPLLEDLGQVDFTGIRWAIIGGETDPQTRAMDTQWAKLIVDQCKERRVAVWVKQLGRRPFVEGEELKLLKVTGRREYKSDRPAVFW